MPQIRSQSLRSHSRCRLEPLEARKLLTSVITTADYEYLSNLRPTDLSNGFGPYQRDRSNGEAGGADGSVMAINSRTYKKGLGVHADSALTFPLNGNYTTFISDVGVDDEVGANGSVVFQVMADNELLYDSGVMTGGMSPRRINIDVSGMNNLLLKVTGTSDGLIDDHADWGGARLVKQIGEAPVVTSPADASLDQARSFFNGQGSFTDPGVGPWVGTVDWGDGSAREYLSLDDNNGYSLNHFFLASAEPYTVTTRINNGGAVGIGTFKVAVADIAPSSVGLAGPTDSNGQFSAFSGLTYRSGGTFSDPGEFGGAETYTASIDFGDGTPAVSPTIDGRFFSVQHVFASPGAYNVITTITDSNGGVGTGTSVVNVAAPTFSYISDMTPTSQAGAARSDRAIGGSRMTINGKRYAKGISVTANSELVYSLGGTYSNLLTDIGVDDEVKSTGAMDFQIYGDGQLLFDSGTMTASRGVKRVDLNVRGVDELRLVVLHGAGRASADDHGDWANLRVA